MARGGGGGRPANVDDMNDGLERRAFIRRVVQVAAAAATAGIAGRDGTAQETARELVDLADTIPTRVLGKTGLELPILGYGGAALPRVWGNPLSLEERVELVRYAYDQGIRYFDTAGNYMESQPLLGEGLKGVRDNVCLATKVETTVPGEVRGAVEERLKQLQTDYIDVIEIHGTPGLEQMSVLRAMEIHGQLMKLRDEGMARHIGFSAHSYFDKALELIASDGFDMCMLSYGYIPRGHDQLFSARMTELRNACVAKAHELGTGIAAMKVIGGGLLGAWSERVVPGFDRKRLRQLPGAAIRHVLQDDRVHLLTIGMRLKHEIDANIEIVAGDTTYTTGDRALLAEYCAKALDSDAIKAMRVD